MISLISLTNRIGVVCSFFSLPVGFPESIKGLGRSQHSNNMPFRAWNVFSLKHISQVNGFANWYQI